MPNIMTDFEHLKSRDDTSLLTRRRDLLASAPLNQLSDEVLVELLAIARILRTRTVSPKLVGTKKAVAPTLDAL